MEKMLTRFCREVKNYFDYGMQKYFGEITITNGQLDGFSDKLRDGQYFRVVNSDFNDGVYQYPASGMTDETFSEGAVWVMRVPADVVEACEKQEEHESRDDVKMAASSPYQSESKADYSYSLKSGLSGSIADDETALWCPEYARAVRTWRKP